MLGTTRSLARVGRKGQLKAARSPVTATRDPRSELITPERSGRRDAQLGYHCAAPPIPKMLACG
jgi:hypothetical protein